MGVFKKHLQQFFTVLSLMQHLVAFLLLMQQNGSYLLIEKGSDAWYYVITARETNKKQKEENTMLTSLACFGIYATVTVGTIWFFSKL